MLDEAHPEGGFAIAITLGIIGILLNVVSIQCDLKFRSKTLICVSSSSEKH